LHRRDAFGILPEPMARFMPYVYAALLAIEFALLTVIYVLWAPPPGSTLGELFGWIGILSMTALLCYSFARRIKLLRDVARLSAWLHFHIFLGCQGVMFALFHSSHLLTKHSLAILNPGLLNLFAVLVVFFSGIFGRYLYSWVPRTLGGELMAAKDIDAEIGKLDAPLPPEVTALWSGAPAAPGLFPFVRLVGVDWQTRQAMSRLRALNLEPNVIALAKRRVLLERRKAALGTANRVFSTWIILHRPLAAALYVLSALHIVLSYMFSAGMGR
jgi:hypothetical protein